MQPPPQIRRPAHIWLSSFVAVQREHRRRSRDFGKHFAVAFGREIQRLHV
jgi:hypothetical protein